MTRKRRKTRHPTPLSGEQRALREVAGLERDLARVMDPRLAEVDIEQLTDGIAALLLLARRARTLHKGLVWLVRAPGGVNAAYPVTRTIVEVAVTAFWIAEHPASRSRLWFAESYRQEAAQLRERADLIHDGIELPGGITEADLRAWASQRVAWREENLERARELAQRDGVAFNKEAARGPQQMVSQVVKERPEFIRLRSAYLDAYRPLSGPAHGGPRGFADDQLRRDDAGTQRLDENVPGFVDELPLRALAITTTAAMFGRIETDLQLNAMEELLAIHERAMLLDRHVDPEAPKAPR